MSAGEHEDDIVCTEFADLVTAYLDNAVDPGRHAAIESHLASCEGCRTVLAQWTDVIRLTGRLTRADIEGADAFARARLLATLRDLRRR